MKPALATIAVLTGASLLAAGCALKPATPSAEVKAPLEYRTGSNIPVREPIPVATPAEREKEQDQIRQLQLRPGVRPPS